MLNRSRNTLRLDAFDESPGEETRQEGVFGVGFEAASAERRTLDVYCWAEEDVGALERERGGGGFN